jgi:hypothetical protein
LSFSGERGAFPERESFSGENQEPFWCERERERERDRETARDPRKREISNFFLLMQ